MVDGVTPLIAVSLAIVLTASLSLALALRPVLLAYAAAATLGAIPFLVIGHVPLSLLCCASLWALPLVRNRWPALSWSDGLTAVIGIATLASWAAHGFGHVPTSEMLRWAVAAGAVYPLRSLHAHELRLCARVFACATAAGAVSGYLALVNGTWATALSTLGYGAYEFGQGTARIVETSGGWIPRLIGPYADPNIAAFILTVGLILAMAFFSGPQRIVLTFVLGAAIILTLSRTCIASCAVAVMLYVAFARGQRRPRLLAGAVGVIAVVNALLTPVLRNRFLESFGSYDIGSAARLSALRSFASDLSGHVWLGYGPGADRFSDPAITFWANPAANGVLYLLLQRGLVAGAALAALFACAAVAGWRLLRSTHLAAAALGAGTLGLMLVAVQLDIVVVAIPPATGVIALLLAVLTHPEVREQLNAGPKHE